MSPEDHDDGVLEHEEGWYYITVPNVNKDYIVWCTEHFEYNDWLQLGRLFYFKRRQDSVAFRLTWLA